MDYQCETYRSLFADSPLIAADYADEHGDSFSAEALRGAIPPPRIFDGSGSGRGSGRGSGSGIGSGNGYGDDYGDGNGYGYGGIGSRQFA